MRAQHTVVLRTTFDHLDIPTVIRRAFSVRGHEDEPFWRSLWRGWISFQARVSTGDVFWR